ncbi:MAG: multiple sugar transport system permease protein [Phycisphaerales bacterium]|jgi:multiple sugar transport system permease protein
MSNKPSPQIPSNTEPIQPVMAAGKKDSKLFTVAAHLTLVPMAIIVLIPFVYLLIASLKSASDFSGSIFLPVGPDGSINLSRLTLSNYTKLFTDPSIAIGRAIVNSLFLASATAALATFLSAAAGYALARFTFKGRKLMTTLVLAAIIIPPPLLLAPGYQLLFDLGLLDTFSGLILPVAAPAFGIFLFRQSVTQAVSPSLLEAARIDGASEFGIFMRIVLPLVRPMIGAFMMIMFLMMWNNFIGPQIVLQTTEKMPLAVVVSQLNGLYRQEYGLLMAGTVVSVLPVAGLFLLLQKEFIAGLTSGAVKG